MCSTHNHRQSVCTVPIVFTVQTLYYRPPPQKHEDKTTIGQTTAFVDESLLTLKSSNAEILKSWEWISTDWNERERFQSQLKINFGFSWKVVFTQEAKTVKTVLQLKRVEQVGRTDLAALLWSKFFFQQKKFLLSLCSKKWEILTESVYKPYTVRMRTVGHLELHLQ